ncbi:hypothetical protein MRX96_058429 [Rhipicephalus microplus]
MGAVSFAGNVSAVTSSNGQTLQVTRARNDVFRLELGSMQAPASFLPRPALLKEEETTFWKSMKASREGSLPSGVVLLQVQAGTVDNFGAPVLQLLPYRV